MISAPGGTAPFQQGIAAAEKALKEGHQVYLYYIDRGVEGLDAARLPQLKEAGAHVYACAYSLQRRGLTPPPEATLSGLTVLSDIMASTDQFQSFN